MSTEAPQIATREEYEAACAVRKKMTDGYMSMLRGQEQQIIARQQELVAALESLRAEMKRCSEALDLISNY